MVGAAAFVLFVPWLGNTFFYSKGEPREAIVAMSMLQSGDWILPVNFGSDIPYKPPLLAWLIAFFSLIFNHGEVSEFTSRLPSAIAAVALVVSTWAMVRRYAGSDRAWVTAILLMTSFEVFRSATACRVDMVLTACTVGAIYTIFIMGNKPLRWLGAILLLSAATLAKGPVGALLPCLVMGIYGLLCRKNFFVTLGRMLMLCALAMIIPALWYYAAYKAGGDNFMSLVLEENIGRLTGRMSYDSHINPWYYNITSMLAGMLPWTIPAIIGLCLRRVRHSLRALRPTAGWPLLCITAFAVIFFFYCIPASKRSVYLLPCYPFACYAVAWILDIARQTRLLRVWCIIMAVLAIVAPLFFAVAFLVPVKGLPLAPLHWWLIPFALLPAVVGIWWLATRRISGMNLTGTLVITFVMLTAYNAAYMPMVLNGRTDARAAETVRREAPADARIYGLITSDSLLRYYGMNFYLDNRMLHATDPDGIPADAWVITEKSDNPRAIPLTARSCDTRRPAVLIPPSAAQRPD